MTEKDAMEKIRGLMTRRNTTVGQLRDVAKACNREVWFSLKKPERNIEVNLSRGTVSKSKRGR